jgi:hypothetical protein
MQAGCGGRVGRTRLGVCGFIGVQHRSVCGTHAMEFWRWRHRRATGRAEADPGWELRARLGQTEIGSGVG